MISPSDIVYPVQRVPVLLPSGKPRYRWNVAGYWRLSGDLGNDRYRLQVCRGWPRTLWTSR